MDKDSQIRKRRKKYEHLLSLIPRLILKATLRQYGVLPILSDINHSRILYDPSPRILEIKAKINKWDLMKLKSF